jgi:hypothetical protein
MRDGFCLIYSQVQQGPFCTTQHEALQSHCSGGIHVRARVCAPNMTYPGQAQHLPPPPKTHTHTETERGRHTYTQIQTDTHAHTEHIHANHRRTCRTCPAELCRPWQRGTGLGLWATPTLPSLPRPQTPARWTSLPPAHPHDGSRASSLRPASETRETLHEILHQHRSS